MLVLYIEDPTNNILVNVCGHCNKCMPRSEAIQCDLCQSWVHASCEGISKETYKFLTK